MSVDMYIMSETVDNGAKTVFGSGYSAKSIEEAIHKFRERVGEEKYFALHSLNSKMLDIIATS